MVRKRLTAKSHWVRFVLLENLGSNEWDGVWLDTGVPVRWQLLLAEEVVHGHEIRLSLVSKRGEKLATRQSDERL